MHFHLAFISNTSTSSFFLSLPLPVPDALRTSTSGARQGDGLSSIISTLTESLFYDAQKVPETLATPFSAPSSKLRVKNFTKDTKRRARN
jgi:hypothetical protein